jgi:hypothetical protein
MGKCESRDIKTKRQQLAHDRVPIAAGFELSGTAILEALAYLSQLWSITHFVDEDATTAVQKRIFDLYGRHLPYTWVIQLAALDAQQEQREPTLTRPISVDARPYGPMLLACLAGRTWLSEDRKPPRYQSLPAARFLAISERLSSAGRSFQGLRVEEAYELIDGTLAQMWSERIASAFEEGLEWEASQLAAMESLVTPEREVPFRVWTDYHETRANVVGYFEADPLAFADVARFAEDVLPRLHPITVFVRPQGATDPPPSDAALVYQDHRSARSGDTEAEFDVWWAYRMKDKRRVAKSVIGFADTEAWIEYLKLFVATSRLLLDGRRVRSICGPEIDIAETLLRNGLDFQLHFDRQYECPDVETNPALFRLVFGEAGKLCDLTSRPLEPESAAFLSPLLIQMNAHNRRYMQEHGPSLALGTGGAWRGVSPDWDWSIWVVHHDVLADLEGCHLQRR